MSLHETASAERLHIGFFGRRNAGKSSLVNAVTGQELAVVSDVKGTTTDPVKKAMELLPLGPVVIIDTPGLDDEGELGQKRVQKALETLSRTDIAVLVVDAEAGMGAPERELESLLKQREIPLLLAFSKADLLKDRPPLPENALYVSAKTGENIALLKDRLGGFAAQTKQEKRLVADLLEPGDAAVLVIPVDSSAPKGRLILPQQQTMRELLDHHFVFSACQPEELEGVLASMKTPPRLVITDSQAFGAVEKLVPADTLLTSFSILFARYKGDLPTLVSGAARLAALKDGDRVLISEGCTHHRQCGDIGSVKLPALLKKYTGRNIDIALSSGRDFPEDLSPYSLVIHCGGCMLGEREMTYRRKTAEDQNVPFTNYGIAIAMMNGILRRSLGVFPDLAKEIE